MPIWRRLALGIALAVALTAGGFALMALPPTAGAASPPSVNVTKGPYRDGQMITISVGANRYFKAYSHVNILECADPGGTKKNLPTSVSNCDGDTIQGNTVLIKKDGSFSEHQFQVFALPNVAACLVSLPSGQPVCSAKHDLRACTSARIRPISTCTQAVLPPLHRAAAGKK